MAAKEATARIKINKLLEAAGWRFFPEDGQPVNIRLEPSVTIKASDLDALGNNFEKAATPRDYLKRFDSTKPTTRDPREAERRLLLDTYRTFGCENSQPTYRYSLLDGLIPRFKSKDELLEEEFAKFVAGCKPEASSPIPAIKIYFKAYATSGRVRDIIDSGQLTDLATNPMFSTRDFKAVPPKYRSLVPAYVEDYVPLNQFM